MLERDDKAEIISNPRITTADNKEAKIEQGVSIPFQTFEGGDAKLEFIDAVLSLKVTPHINEGDSIVLAVEQEVSSLTGSTDVDVVTNERKIDTQILIAEGQTAVLGGLIKDEMQESEQRVPLLGSIPVLGALFRTTKNSERKTDLIILVTPHIVD